MLPPVFSTLKDASAVTEIIGSPPRAYRHAEAPQDTTRPYVTWSASGAPENQLSGLPSTDRVSIQVDCWHQTDQGVLDLGTAVRDAIEPLAHMTSFPIDQRDPETKLYRMTLQFDWFVDRIEISSS